MKPTTKKFFVELNKKRSNKVNLSLNEDANKIMDNLHNFRVTVGELFQEGNELHKEEERVAQMWRNLAEEGERILREYRSTYEDGESIMDEAREKAADLGITPNDIPYYQELLNSINDTKEDEDGLVDGIRNWQDKSN